MESTLSTLTDACRNPNMHRHFWEYECIMFDFSIVPDQADRCRFEIFVLFLFGECSVLVVQHRISN